MSDFSKAFYCINRDTLLKEKNKLYLYGVRGVTLKLIKSYLHDRYQCVEINRNRYNLMPITAGVPQGSMLGPLLFNLYIKYLVNN